MSVTSNFVEAGGDGDAFIYHEKQESLLCGQHCLNNLLQGPYFSAADLSEIAHELDAKERHVMYVHIYF